MKALIFQGPRHLEIEERPVPQPKEGEVLIRVKACGICGSDVHGYLGITGRRVGGYAMGHEFSGIVEKAGSKVRRFCAGDSVIVQPIASCGSCDYCKEGNNNLCGERKLMGVMDVPGAMAEYVCVPEEQLISMPENCDFSTAALTEPFAVAYAAVSKISDYTDKTVLIIGAGMIGLCILEMLKIMKPKKIIISDLSSARLMRAKNRGADDVINPGQDDFMRAIAEITEGQMCDVTIEAVGTEPAANQAIRALKKNGVSVWTGVSQHEIRIDMHEIVTCQRRITGSMNYTRRDFLKTVQLLESGELMTDGLISETVSLKDAAAMFEKIHQFPDRYLKVMIADK